MAITVKMEVKPEEIIEAVERIKKDQRKVFLEDLIASTSPEYLASIKEARKDYEEGRVKTHREAFGR